MKILIGAHHYPPDFVAGVELLTERLARWMLARGHAVEVICIERVDVPGPVTVRTSVQDGVVVHRLQLQINDKHFGLRFRDDALRDWFEAFLRNSLPDVYHSQSSYLLTGSFIEAAKRVGIPVVASLHDYWYLCPRITLLRSDGDLCSARVTPADCAACLMSERRRYRLTDAPRRWLTPRGQDGIRPAAKPWWPLDQGLVASNEDRQTYLERVLHSVDRIVTPAPLVKDLLLERGFAREHVRLVRQGMNGRARLGIPEHKAREGQGLRIGFLGQMAPHKGLHLLIDAFQQLTSPNQQPQLAIYGNETIFPKYVRRLKRLAKANRRVSFRGTYSNEEVDSVLSELDVLVVPSLWYEISPLVILEAFAAGVPVVATDLPNMNYQIKHERDGLLFKPHDAKDLQRQLQRLIDQPDLLESLRRGIQPTHPVDTEMHELEEIYGAVVARPAQQALVKL